MAEKHLTELAWKTLARKHSITDSALAKALADYGKLKEGDPDKRLEALADIDKHAEKLKATNKKNKEVVDYLTEITKEAEKTRQTLEKEKGAKAASAKDDKDEKDTDLATALKRVQAGGQLQFVACRGKPFLVMVAKTITSSHKRALSEKNGSFSYTLGACIFEENAHTFVVARVQGGLASQLKKALHEQTGKMYKVRVRGIEDKKVLDDATDAEETGQPPVNSLSWEERRKAVEPRFKEALLCKVGNTAVLIRLYNEARQLATATHYADALAKLAVLEKELDVLRTPAASPAAAAPKRINSLDWVERRKVVEPKLKAALQARKGDVARFVQMFNEANRLANEQNFAAAVAKLDELDALLPDLVAAAPLQPAQAPAKPAALAANRPAYAMLAKLWTTSITKAHQELATLKQAILAVYEGGDDYESATSAVDDLDYAVEQMDQGLGNLLQQATAADAGQEPELRGRALDLVKQLQDYLGQDPLLLEIDDNPFRPVAIRKTIDTTLQALAGRLAI